MESRVYRVAGVSAVLEPDFQAAPASGDGEARPAPDSQGALAEVPATSGARSASNGLVWAMISLALDLIEVVVLVEIVFFDKPAFNGAVSFGFLHVYLVMMVAATIGQGLGVLSVAHGWYRVGGAMQIVASAVQVFKVDGIIGVVGGVKAWRYADGRQQGNA